MFNILKKNKSKKSDNSDNSEYYNNSDYSDHYESDVELLEVYFDNNVYNNSNDNNRSINNNNTSLKLKKKIVKLIEKNKYFFIFIFHILMHISLLSLLEPLFFFKYASKIENEVFLNKLKSLIVNISNNIKRIEIGNTNFINFLLEYFNLDSLIKIVNYFNYLDKISILSEKQKNEYNNKLEFKSFIPSIILLSITFFYVFFIKYFINIKTTYIFIEHIILIIFIGLYEYWFFENILLKYKPISNTEIDNLFISCTFNNIKNNIDIMNISEYEAICNL